MSFVQKDALLALDPTDRETVLLALTPRESAIIKRLYGLDAHCRNTRVKSVVNVHQEFNLSDEKFDRILTHAEQKIGRQLKPEVPVK